MAESLSGAISRALKQVQAPEKLDGTYQGTVPEEILEKTKAGCPWYDDKSQMPDFSVRITNGEVSAIWTEMNVHNDLQERLKALKESSRNWREEYCSEGELWSYIGFEDYEAYISVLENWETEEYFGSYPKKTVSRFDTTGIEGSGYSDVKPDLEKTGA